MNPLINIWTKTSETIDHFKDSTWVYGQGLIFYTLFAINSVGESKLPLLVDSKIGGIIIVLAFGLIGGAIFRLVWVNFIFYFGKIWKGQATKRNIDTVIALCLIPEIFKFLNLSIRFILQDNYKIVEINYTLTIICFILSIRILLIGLTRVQKFGYGMSVLNLIVPQLVIVIIYYSIRGL